MLKIIAPFVFCLGIVFSQPMIPENQTFLPLSPPHSLMMAPACENCEMCFADEDEIAIAELPEKPGGPKFAEKRPKEKLEMIQTWKLTEVLNLTEDQSLRFFPKLKELRRAREEFDQKRMKILDEIEDYLRDAKKYEKELKAKIQEMELSETKFQELEKKLRKEIASILTPEQQAKFMLFQMRFNEELRDIIHRAKEMKKEMRPKRPWRFW
ncbi:MAG: hypothetical protein N2201_04515 [candidate division WOR-3 bacterium]|nr:hypothetical protein [candidate division WOR-3 bacterium]